MLDWKGSGSSPGLGFTSSGEILMSYEGYEVTLCERGHRRTVDSSYYYGGGNPPIITCSCGAPFVWHADIDQTNGCDDQCDKTKFQWCHEGLFEVREVALYQKCDLGHTHTIREETYHPPKDFGYKIL